MKQKNPWKKHSVWKRPEFYAKPQVGIGDMAGDGKMNVGMLRHNDMNLIKDKASESWMKYGNDPRGEWSANVIKWSDGYNSRQWDGEKWDHCLFYNVDRDGGFDLVGNVEEHYRRSNGECELSSSIVWFENFLK